MKNRTLLLSLSVLPLAVLLAFFLFPAEKQREYTPRSMTLSQSIGGSVEFWRMIRHNQITGEVDPADIEQALMQLKSLDKAKGSSWDWEEMGPDNLGGRTRAIIFDRNNPAIMYAGAVSGGLWKTTTNGSSWVQVPGFSQSMVVSCITQAPNGDLYVGTGEALLRPYWGMYGTGSSGFEGGGIYKADAGTDSFRLLSATSTWKFINEIEAHPTNGNIYAATNNGLRISGDGGTTWSLPTLTPSTSNINSHDVDIASDGTILAVINKNCYISSSPTEFTRISGTTSTLPQAGVRMEMAIAPSDPNYLYASLVGNNESTQGVYRSTDKGTTWTQIAPAASTSFNIHGGQGMYNNTIAVYPNNKNRILVGGIDIWSWEQGGTWTQITSSDFPTTYPFYVHADIHEFVFHPNNPDIIFVGCDGGIHRSLDGGYTWTSMNKNYSTIQFFAITSSGSGQVLGGTQDNSNQFIDFKGNTPRAARTVFSGDGGYAAISQFTAQVNKKSIHEAIFVTAQYGAVGRSALAGASGTWQGAGTSADPAFFSARMLTEGAPGNASNPWSSFVTPLALWETIHAYDSQDSIEFVADTNYLAGEIITLRAPQHGYPFRHTLLAGLNKGDTMKIQNPIQSMFILAGRRSLWITREPHNFSGTPQWYKLGEIPSSNINTFTISNDGDHIFVGSAGGTVYRFSNIRQAYDSLSTDMGTTANPNASQVVTMASIASHPGRTVTSIAVDPANNNHVVYTLGNYGNANYVYRSANATTASPTFESKQGGLPTFPVYSALIPMNAPNTLMVGTEFGAFVTTNLNLSNPTWTEINTEMGRVPILMLHQQTHYFPYDTVSLKDGHQIILIEYPETKNYGGIYAGTHGRGAFRNLSYVTTGIEKPVVNKPGTFRSQLLVYPNPVESNATAVVNLGSSQRAQVTVYDITGKVVATINPGLLKSGRNEISLELGHLKRGNYIVQVVAGGESKSTKIIKR